MSLFDQSIDEVTLKRAQKGQRKALRSVYDAFSKPVYNLAYRMVQNRDDAMDVMQNTLLQAFAKLGQLKKPERLGFWIRRIAINQSIDLIKQNAPLCELSEAADLVDEREPGADVHDIEYHLRALPPISRSVLWLYEVEGMTHQEIAEIYQMSESFSKSQLARSRKLLAQSHAVQEHEHEREHEQTRI